MPQVHKTFAITQLHSKIKALLQSRKREPNKSECGSYGHLVRVIRRRERSILLTITISNNISQENKKLSTKIEFPFCQIFLPRLLTRLGWVLLKSNVTTESL